MRVIGLDQLSEFATAPPSPLDSDRKTQSQPFWTQKLQHFAGETFKKETTISGQEKISYLASSEGTNIEA